MLVKPFQLLKSTLQKLWEPNP